LPMAAMTSCLISIR